jgi:hypothetical protein
MNGLVDGWAGMSEFDEDINSRIPFSSSSSSSSLFFGFFSSSFCFLFLVSPFSGLDPGILRVLVAAGNGGVNPNRAPNIRVEIPLRNPTQVCQAGNCTSQKKKGKALLPLAPSAHE